MTAEEEATIAGTGLSRRTQAVEPLSGYSVVRARREFANQSNVGFMLTSTNRKLVDVVELPARGRLHRRRRLRHPLQPALQHLRLLGRLARRGIDRGDHAPAGEQRPRVSAARCRSRRARRNAPPCCRATPASFNFGKIAGEKTRFSANYGYKSPGFDINDLGFQRRADERYVSHWFQMRDKVPGRFTRSFIWNLNQYAGWNFDGDRLWSGGNVNMHWTWKNYYTTSFGFNVNGAPFRDRVTRGGPGGARQLEPRRRGTTSAPTAARACRPATTAISRAIGKGTTRHQHRPVDHLAPDDGHVGVDRVPLQHQQRRCAVGDQRGGGRQPTHYVFGASEAAHVGVHVPRQLHADAEPVDPDLCRAVRVGRRSTRNYKELVNGRAPKYDDRYRPYAYDGNADFNFRSFRTTNVLRWEYKPGSSLFVVWQQNRSGFEDVGDFDFGRDFGGVFSRARAQRVPGEAVVLAEYVGRVESVAIGLSGAR